MNEKEFDKLKDNLILDIGLADSEQAPCRKVLDTCLKAGGTDDRYLSVQIKNGQGTLITYKMHFNLITAISLLRSTADAACNKIDIFRCVNIILNIITTLFHQEKIPLDSVQIAIVVELYENHKNKGRSLSEEDLYERLIQKSDSQVKEKKSFVYALEQLRKLTCVEIVDGIVELKEKVEF